MALLSTLTLFPPYSLDTSILVAVLVGVLILALFTETLGWVFVGLVVPGYLASIFVINPEAGATVAVEALLTYGLAVLLSKVMSRTGAWSEFFGRDRFFLVVLASVLVRAVAEAWLLPHAGRWLDARFDTTFVLDRSLHSIGLVLVPLTANAFWKLKLRRGLLQVGVPVLLTYAVLRWVLLPGTNLSFGSLELVYEDIARSFLASPKAYIILLTTSLLAARFNLKYGWDFNGILVPALLALTWLSPGKLVATVVEVLMLVAATRAVLTLPGLRTLNLEGPRKTVLVFTLGFLLKFCIGWALGGRIPGLKVTDLFGFGYLVPTLLAVKMLQRQVVARIVLPSLHTSLAGFVLGSLIGFGLSLLEPTSAVATPAAEASARAPTLGLARSPLGVMALARVGARESEGGDSPLRRRRSELRRYSVLWRDVDRWLTTQRPEDLAQVQQGAQRLGLELRALEAGAPGSRARFVLAERETLEDRVGWDTAVLVPGAPGPVLEVPRPLAEAPSAEAAAVLCERVQCRVILVSGVDTSAVGLLQGDALLEEQAPLLRAHGALDAHPRILIRSDASLGAQEARVHVAEGALAPPEALWPGARRAPGPPPEPGLAWEQGRVSVLRVHPRALRAAVLAQARDLGPALSGEQLLAALTPSEADAGRAGATPAAPSEAELRVLEREVAAPLLAASRAGPASPQAAAEREEDLRWATLMAGLMDLQVRPVQDCGLEGGRCWLLTEPDARRGRLGAGLLVRAGGAPLAVESPAPTREAGTLPIALELWAASGAQSLLVADPSPLLPADAPQPATPGNFRTGFQALHQALQRALPSEGGLLLQVRGFSARPAAAADVLVELDGPVLTPAQRPPALAALLSERGALGWLGPRVRDHDGSPELAGLNNASPQGAFSATFGGAPFATLWLSEHLRGAYVGPRRAREQLALAGFPPDPAAARSPLESLLTPGLQAAQGPVPPALLERFERLAAAAERRLRQQNVHDLRVLARAGKGGASERVELHWSPEHGLPYLLLEARQGRRLVRGVYFLQEELSPLPRVELSPADPAVRQAVQRALRQRSPVLITAQAPAAASRTKEVRP